MLYRTSSGWTTVCSDNTETNATIKHVKSPVQVTGYWLRRTRLSNGYVARGRQDKHDNKDFSRWSVVIFSL